MVAGRGPGVSPPVGVGVHQVRAPGAGDRRNAGVSTEASEQCGRSVGVEDQRDESEAPAAGAGERVNVVDALQKLGPIDALGSRASGCRCIAYGRARWRRVICGDARQRNRPTRRPTGPRPENGPSACTLRRDSTRALGDLGRVCRLARNDRLAPRGVWREHSVESDERMQRRARSEKKMGVALETRLRGRLG